MKFGELIRSKRIQQNLTLRGFCVRNRYDAGYISRLENDLILPPANIEDLQRLANALRIDENTEEWDEFCDLAAIARGSLPKNLDKKVIEYLPAFFRKASKKKIKKSDVEKLLDLIKGS